MNLFSRSDCVILGKIQPNLHPSLVLSCPVPKPCQQDRILVLSCMCLMSFPVRQDKSLELRTKIRSPSQNSKIVEFALLPVQYCSIICFEQQSEQTDDNEWLLTALLRQSTNSLTITKSKQIVKLSLIPNYPNLAKSTMASSNPKVASVDNVEEDNEEEKPVDEGENNRVTEHYRPLLIATAVFGIVACAFYLGAAILVLIGEFPQNCFCSTRTWWYLGAGSLLLATILFLTALCKCVNSDPQPEDMRLRRTGGVSSVLAVILFIVASPFLSTQDGYSVTGYVLAMISFILTVPLVTSSILLVRSKEARMSKCTVFWFTLAVVVLVALLIVGSFRFDSYMPIDDYPNCVVEYPYWIGDGVCDGRTYATEECGYDGGDCLLSGSTCDYNEECVSEICNGNICEWDHHTKNKRWMACLSGWMRSQEKRKSVRIDVS